MVRLAIPLVANESLADLTSPVLAISPDGTHLVYVATRDGGARQLYLRALDSLEAKALLTPTSPTFGQPFFSPDGQWLGYGGDLSKISISGGAPVVLDSTPPSFQGGSWGDNDRIVYAPNYSGRLWEIPTAGGTPQPLTKLDAPRHETSHRWPQVLAGSNTVLFTAATGGSWDDAEIVAQRLDSGERKVMVQGGTYGRYVPTGHLVYVRGGTLMAVPLDLERLEITGTAVPVVEHVVQSTTSGGVQIAISN
ncbi:MAG: PD40 domain-containing protein [Acidobacteria bacterium]|nr:PD40 domain-containing protein [Acidobacteriota bacterium]